MHSRLRTLAVAVLFASLCAAVTPAQEADANANADKALTGKPISVTLYRGQAQVTREVPVSVGRGASEIVITSLPVQVVPDSLFAEGGKGVEVRAVRFRSRHVARDIRDDVRKLDEQIRSVGDAIDLNTQQQELLKRRNTYLDNLENFTATTARADLAKGALDAEALQKLTLFVFEHRELITKRSIDLRKEQRELGEQLSLLQRERNQIAGAASRVIHEAVVFVDKAADAASTLTLTYLVNNCGWQPGYNFRAEQKAGKVRIEYNALITQMSGEDWSNVKLTLSTASPALAASGPGLAPLLVALASGNRPEPQAPEQVGGQWKALEKQQRDYNMSNAMAATQSAQFDTSYDINRIAAQLQCFELNTSTELLDRALMLARIDSGQPSLTYALEQPLSLASRNDQQMIRIASAEVAGDFYHVATPVLTPMVYREAQMTNSTDTDLLAGSVSVYLDGRFVGRTEIATVARGQSFILGFGADPQLKAGRELVHREETEQGGNRVQHVRYRLVLENFKTTPALVRVYDRTPHVERSRDLRITLDTAPSDPLSTDEVYLRRERTQGILRWDVTVDASASGAKARFIEYGYRMEFDRNLTLALPATGNGAEDRKQFEDMQMQRFYAN